MSMSHKAYAFDWDRFSQDALYDIVLKSIVSNDPARLAEFVEERWKELRSPYDGELLEPDWSDILELDDNAKVLQLADIAITAYYDPASDFGLAEAWQMIDERLPPTDRVSLLGEPIELMGVIFDPGLMGSYFQKPACVVESRKALSTANLSASQTDAGRLLSQFICALEDCERQNRGMYVTF